jgi:hypothetical protein
LFVSNGEGTNLGPVEIRVAASVETDPTLLPDSLAPEAYS